jgi:hypothetical protein
VEVGILTWSENPEMALRVAAQMRVREGPRFLLLSGSSAALARQIAAMIEEIEVVALHAGLRSTVEVPGVSRMTAGPVLPFRSGSLRGVVFEGESGRSYLREGVRTLVNGGRLVLVSPPSGVSDEIRQLGFEVILEDETTLVGVSRGR